MKVHLPRTFVATILGSFYVLSFIVSPYWLLANSPNTKILILIATISLGVSWSYLSADSLQIQLKAKNKLVFGLFLLGMAIINYRALSSVIPWGGDENVHITRVLTLLSQIKTLWIVILFILFFAVLYSAWHRPNWAPVTLGLSTIVIIVFFTNNNPIQGERLGWILRYPLLNYWIFMLVPKFAGSIFNPYYEILYRIVPFLCMGAVAWSIQREIPVGSNFSKLLWSFSIATMPIVYYYSSILYIEPLAVIFMLVVCFQARDLLYDDYNEIRKNPAWYALLFIGFIKETVIIFLLCYLVCRLIFQYVKRKSEGLTHQKDNETLEQEKYTLSYITGEIKIFFSVFIPYLFYLFLRATLSINRNLIPELHGLVDISVYRAIGQSFLEQFGPFAILFCIGCILLFKRREYATLIFLLAILASFPLFHAIDQKGIYAGYSRFNLFIIPSILAGTLIAVKYLINHKKALGIILPGIMICTNLLITPINLDGTKKPFWGSYLIDTSEHYYPYRSALSWLHDNYGNARILSTGMSYPYFFEFYFDKLNWKPKIKVEEYYISGDIHVERNLYFDNSSWKPKRRIEQLINAIKLPSEEELLSRAIDVARQGNHEIVLYQVLGRDIPHIVNSDFRQVKVITNDAHTLVIYAKIR